jgi:hypothetical protein
MAKNKRMLADAGIWKKRLSRKKAINTIKINAKKTDSIAEK